MSVWGVLIKFFSAWGTEISGELWFARGGGSKLTFPLQYHWKYFKINLFGLLIKATGLYSEFNVRGHNIVNSEFLTETRPHQVLSYENH